VREAAYRIIGAGGDAHDVDSLLKAAAGDTGAVHAMVKLSGDDVTEILIKKLAAGSPETQRHIIEIMTERGDEAFAVPLLKLVGGDNRPVSLMAIKSLKRVGDVNTARKLVELLNDEKLASSYRRAMETSLANILLRFSGKLDISGFMTANYRKSDNAAKASLLRVMGSLQDDSTLKLIAGAAQNSNAEIRTAAVRSLTRWRSEAAIEPLLQVAGSGSGERDNALCLAAAARLLRASKRPQNELLPLYEKGRKLAQRDEERKLFEVKK
jgi:HEAT repeat protein